jgi:hypothetical protein
MLRSSLSLFAALLLVASHAQNYNWGWGPPISVTQNGSTITCSVLDPLTDQIRTTSLTSVSTWTHDDGVVATVSPTGSVRGVVYDIDLGSFQETQLSSNSGNAVVNSDGVVAWVSGTGIVGAAIYDPALQQWRSEQLSSNSGNQIQNRDGVVSWVSASGIVGAAVYDPGNSQWMDDQLSSNSGNVVQNRDGIVGWVSSSGIVGAAVYDPALGQWVDEQLSSNSGDRPGRGGVEVDLRDPRRGGVQLEHQFMERPAVQFILNEFGPDHRGWHDPMEQQQWTPTVRLHGRRSMAKRGEHRLALRIPSRARERE